MEEYQPEQTFGVTLSRPDSGIAWGFRLQGGVDFNTQLSVQMVQPGGVAESCGLRAGDGILAINNQNTDEMSHENAKMAIIRSSNDINLIVQRGAVQIWKPKVSKMSELRPNELRQIETATGEQVTATQKTSLAKSQADESSIGSGHNRSARPFPGSGVGYTGQPQQQPQQYQQQPQQYQQQPQQYQQQPQQYQQQPQQYQQQPQRQPQQQQYGPKKAVPKVVHAQFNSPIGLYSAGNIAHSYKEQTEHIESEMQNLDIEGVPLGTKMSGTYQQLDQPDAGSGFRSVKAPVAKPPGQQAPKPDSMYCNGCGNLVTGVFVRIKGMPYHDRCFKCESCGVFLKQKGYFMVEGKLYCETHARRMAEPPGPDMKHAGAVYQ